MSLKVRKLAFAIAACGLHLAIANIVVGQIVDDRPISIHSYAADPFFTSDQLPPVIVWVHTGLEDQLLTPAQFKAWRDRLPEPDQATAPRRPGHNARQVVFLQTEPQGPDDGEAKQSAAPKTTDDQPKIDDSQFETRLAEIKKRIENREQQISDDQSLADGTRTDLLSQLAIATENYQTAVQDSERLKTQSQAESNFGSALAAQRAVLKRERNTRPASISRELESADELKAALRETEDKLQQAIEKQTDDQQENTELEKRIADLPSQRSEISRELLNLKKESEDVKKLPDGPSRSLQTLIIDARLLAAEIRDDLLVIESARQGQLNKLYPLERSTLALKIKRLEAEADVLRQAVDEKLQLQIQAQKEKDSRELEGMLTQDTPVLKTLAEENVNLTAETENLIGENKQLAEELEYVRQKKSEIEQSYEKLKQYIGTRGKTASGIRLIEHRRSLISTGQSRSRLSILESQLQASRTELFRLKEIREQLSHPEEILATIQASPGVQQLDRPETQVQHRDAMGIAQRLVQSQTQYVDEIIKEYDSKIETLSDLEVAHKQLVDTVQEIKSFSDENALWIRSADPIGFSELRDSRAGAIEFFNGTQWKSMLDTFGQRFQSRPYDAACLVTFVGVLLVVQRRLRWTHAQ